MAVLMTAKVPEMTAEIYDGMASMLMPRLRHTKGFVSHAAGVDADGVWTIIEVWESEDDSMRWFNENVKPNLPAGITPDRVIRTLHNFMKA